MKDNYDFSKGRKNPYAAKLKKEGYTVSIHYDPQEVAGQKHSDYNKDEQLKDEALTLNN